MLSHPSILIYNPTSLLIKYARISDPPEVGPQGDSGFSQTPFTIILLPMVNLAFSLELNPSS